METVFLDVHSTTDEHTGYNNKRIFQKKIIPINTKEGIIETTTEHPKQITRAPSRLFDEDTLLTEQQIKLLQLQRKILEE